MAKAVFNQMVLIVASFVTKDFEKSKISLLWDVLGEHSKKDLNFNLQKYIVGQIKHKKQIIVSPPPTCCRQCQQPTNNNELTECARCCAVVYCSIKCELGDWQAHKKECALLQQKLSDEKIAKQASTDKKKVACSYALEYLSNNPYSTLDTVSYLIRNCFARFSPTLLVSELLEGGEGRGEDGRGVELLEQEEQDETKESESKREETIPLLPLLKKARDSLIKKSKLPLPTPPPRNPSLCSKATQSVEEEEQINIEESTVWDLDRGSKPTFLSKHKKVGICYCGECLRIFDENHS